jgi:hypothetical protein
VSTMPERTFRRVMIQACVLLLYDGKMRATGEEA